MLENVRMSFWNMLKYVEKPIICYKAKMFSLLVCAIYNEHQTDYCILYVFNY